MTSLILRHHGRWYRGWHPGSGAAFLARSILPGRHRTRPQHASSEFFLVLWSRPRPAARQSGMHGQLPHKRSACKPRRSRVALTLCTQAMWRVHTDLLHSPSKLARRPSTISGARPPPPPAMPYNMLGDIGVAPFFSIKAGGQEFASRALSDLTFSNVTTNGANIFLHKNRPPSFSD